MFWVKRKSLVACSPPLAATRSDLWGITISSAFTPGGYTSPQLSGLKGPSWPSPSSHRTDRPHFPWHKEDNCWKPHILSYTHSSMGKDIHCSSVGKSKKKIIANPHVQQKGNGQLLYIRVNKYSATILKVKYMVYMCAQKKGSLLSKSNKL